MTLRTFLLCLRGYNKRQQEDMRRRAWEVAHQVSLWSKDPITPASLLGEERSPTMFTSAEEYHAHMKTKRQRAADKRRKEASKR